MCAYVTCDFYDRLGNFTEHFVELAFLSVAHATAAKVFEAGSVALKRVVKRDIPWQDAMEMSLKEVGASTVEATNFLSKTAETSLVVKTAAQETVAMAGATRIGLSRNAQANLGQGEVIVPQKLKPDTRSMQDVAAPCGEKVSYKRSPGKVKKSPANSIKPANTNYEKLEQYAAKKIAKTSNCPFEKINSKHSLGIEKEIKTRANGVVDAKYRGYHHDPNFSLVKKGKVKFLTEPIVCPKTGSVYVKEMLVEGVLVKDQTFFSPNLSQKQVLDKVFEASKNIVTNETKLFIRDGSMEILGMTNEGMQVKMYITKEKILHSFYPVFKGKK